MLAVMLLAAWGLPPVLDWGRFRAGFAAIAAAQLGRPVLLGGQVSLRLLPEAVLTATNVSLPDQGDGMSGQLGAMRLQVAVLPLLTGRIVPRDLILGTPVLRLPWPLPQALTYRARPPVPRGFAAHVESGTLRLGQVQITGINASLHGSPEPSVIGPQPDAPSASAFAAEGFAAFGGRTWRFTSALGAPDADGVSALDLSVIGEGAAAETGGSMQATLTDGVVQGRLRAGGPDLLLLRPGLATAPALPWLIEAPFTADYGRIEASAVKLSLGALPAEASLALRLAAPARLDGQAHAAAVDLDAWARVLGPAQQGAGTASALPFRLALSADTARLLGGTLAGLQATVVSDGASLRLEQARATLPGLALLQCNGAVTRGASGLQLSGPASLDAADVHKTLAWLHSVAPSPADDVPLAALQRAHVAGQLTLAQHIVAVSDMSGEVDGAGVAGSFGMTLGGHPHVAMSLNLARLSLDDWLGGMAPGASMASVAQRLTRLDSDLHVKADRASWHGLLFEGVVLDARTGPAGLVVDHVQAALSGAALSAKGALGPDGSVTNGRLAASTPDASPLLGLLPTRWRLAPALWKGAASLKAAVSGQPEWLGVQLRADAGDLVLEADWRADTLRHGLAGTVTLRHPGAPRLAASLGLPNAESWLGTGSLALRAQMDLRPDQLSVPDFDLAAADMRLSGTLALDRTTVPFLHGTVAAETLALPEPSGAKALLDGLSQEKLPQDWPPRWAAQLSIAAQLVSLGGKPALAGLTATLGLGGGDGLLDVTHASAAGGEWTGQLAYVSGTTALAAAHVTLQGAHIQGPVFGLPIDLLAGEAAASMDVQTSGADMAALWKGLSGQLVVSVRDAKVGGFDLGLAGRVLGRPARVARAALQTALSSGSTPGLSGQARLDVAQGRFNLASATLTSSQGALLVQGWADSSALDVNFGLVPASAPLGRLAVRMFGSFGSVRAMADPGSAGATTRRARRG